MLKMEMYLNCVVLKNSLYYSITYDVSSKKFTIRTYKEMTRAGNNDATEYYLTNVGKENPACSDISIVCPVFMDGNKLRNEF